MTLQSLEEAPNQSRTTADVRRSALLTAGVLVACAPFVVVLCWTLWRTPIPLTEAVALLEDVAIQPATRFLSPDTSYYRPLFHMVLSALWHHAGSLEGTVAGIKLLHIVPVVILIVTFIVTLRPESLLDAAAATAAVLVLIGSPGFRDNLELPLSYTIVGMPIALIVWMLLNRARRPWHATAVIALTLIAIGFKEQGLVIVPLIVAAWWMRAPGATRGVAVTAGMIAVAYVALRLSAPGSWPMFQQSVGYGFAELEPPEAVARFGDFPLWIYAYSSVSTIANVLFSEPTRGVFWITRDFVRGHLWPFEVIQLCSAVALTSVIAWWGTRSLIADRGRELPRESRTFVALLVALAACGVLSFNYSRDRLGGMAAVFYALAAYFAIRAAAGRVSKSRRPRAVAAGIALAVLGTAWLTRTMATIEYARITSVQNQHQWLVMLPERRLEFAERPVYLRIMHSLIGQGTAPDIARPADYPRWMVLTLGLTDAQRVALPGESLADAIASGDVSRAFEFIRAGQNPNDLIPARHGVITNGRWVLVSPLVWAVATQQKDMVLMLLGHGARVDRPMDRRAVCLARQLGNQEIARILTLDGNVPTVTCSPRTPNDAPLLAFLADSASGQ